MLGLQCFEDQTQRFDNSRQTCCWLSYSPSSLLPVFRCFSPLWLSSDPVRLPPLQGISFLPATSASSPIYRPFHLRVIVIVLCLIRLLLVVIRMQIFHDRPQRTWGKTWATGSQANTSDTPDHIDTGDTCSTDLWLRTTIQLRLCKQIRDTFQITISTWTLLFSS